MYVGRYLQSSVAKSIKKQLILVNMKENWNCFNHKLLNVYKNEC